MLPPRSTRLSTLEPAWHSAQIGEACESWATCQVSFVGFDRLAFAANGAQRTILHGLADAMRHEPRGLVGHAQRAMDLVRADAFLGRAQQECVASHHLVERDLRCLETRCPR